MLTPSTTTIVAAELWEMIVRFAANDGRASLRAK
jgi:hypothetical protein